LIATYVIVAIGSYLLGSIPFGYLLVRTFKGSDIRQTGSGNIGATNVARSGSKWLGLLTLLLDAAKGALAVGLTLWFFYWGAPRDFFRETNVVYLLAGFAALCAIVGHMFPVWLRFRGGKGVATAAGAFLVLAPRALLASLAIFIVIVVITRFVSLGSIVSVALFPVGVWFFGPDRSPAFLLLVSASALLIIVKHQANIRRLLGGTENKFAPKMSSVPPAAEMGKHS
jgi:glycerol-3-phosphate acyltransferase PlsY